MSNVEEKSKITVDIYGNQYKLMASSSTNYMKKVAEYVNDQMFRIAKGYPRLDSQRIAVLAAVNMADECFRMNESLDELSKLRKSQEESHAQYEKLLQAHNLLLQEKERHLQQQQEQASKHEELLLELQKLKVENEKLQEQTTAIIFQAEREREKSEAVIEQLELAQKQVSAEKEELLEQHRSEKDRLLEQQLQDKELTRELFQIKEDYRELREEYAKLQNEYNEWIQLVDSEPGR